MAVGTHRGFVQVKNIFGFVKYFCTIISCVQVWDVTANKRVNTLVGHSARVGALAWNGDMLSSGSRDRWIFKYFSVAIAT